MIKLLLPFCFLFLLLSCGDGLPAGVIGKEKMKIVLWEYLKADAYAYNFLKKDSLHADTIQVLKMQDSIFKKYKISRKQFQNSYEYYAFESKHFTTMLDSIVAQRQSESINILQQKSNSELRRPVKDSTKIKTLKDLIDIQDLLK